jgi:hypothetical protein
VAKQGDNYYLYASSDSGDFLAAGGGRFGGANEDTRAEDPLNSSEWSHLAVTYDARIVRLYVNGRLTSVLQRWSSHRPMAAQIGELPLPPGTISDPAAFRASIGHPLRVRIICGAPEDSRGRVFRISRGVPPYDDLLRLVAEGPDLLIAVATRARRLELPSPDYQVRDVFRQCAQGDVRDLLLTGSLRNPQVMTEGREVRGTGASLDAGWALLLHSELMPSSVRAALSALWLAALFIPSGLWIRPGLAGALGSVLLVGGAAVLPPVLGMRPLGLSDWLWVAAGVGLGWVLRCATPQRVPQVLSTRVG